MENESGKDPKALPDEALDEAAGGLSFNGQQPSDASFPGFQGSTASITDGTSNTKAGYVGGSRLTGDFNNDGDVSVKLADGSVKPGA